MLQRRVAVQQLLDTKVFSERKACGLIDIKRSSFRYKSQKAEEEIQLRKKIRELSEANPRYGYRRIWALLKREGMHINEKRVHRIWKAEGLQRSCRRPKRRRCPGRKTALMKAVRPNHVWSYDFVYDRTEKGGSLKMLTILDVFTRECLAIHIAKSITHEDVQEVLSELFLQREVPEYIRSDNGSEFIAGKLREWLEENGCQTQFINPGSPWENAHIESFHDKLRSECLNREIFCNVHEAQVLVELWRCEYNEYRPHSTLGYLTPKEFVQQYENDSAERIGAT